MKIRFEHDGKTYEADTAAGTSIAIPLQFDGPQVNHFGAPAATVEPLRLGDFVRKTEAGGSCNVDQLRLIPHCNSTHTETISHIVNQDIWIGHAAEDVCCMAAVVSVPITPAVQTDEAYRPPLAKTDSLVTAKSLKRAIARIAGTQPKALVIRTLPNDAEKRTRKYTEGAGPAFLTVDAMEAINELGVCHLLLDLPSVDRMYDDGLLTNHHIFWGVPEKLHELSGDSSQGKTITEMVFVEDDLEDGLYLLNLQIPSFSGDAAPSRPILLPITQQ
ncbi:MAG: cyclase family protein [Aureliella sp.]